MTGSTLSLESLSSPSPSPSPPPGMAKLSEPNNVGLNSDSELSELTEEEQEADKAHKSPRKGQRNGVARRGRHPSRRRGRRKTNSIVPAPMWGWAETKSSSNVLEEEEEEESRGPPRAMEEEEEDEEPRDDEEDELGRSKNLDEAEDDPSDADDLPIVNGDDPENDDESFVSGEDPLRCTGGYSQRSTRTGSPAPSAESEDEGGGDENEYFSDLDEPSAGPRPKSRDDMDSEDEPVDERDVDSTENALRATLPLPSLLLEPSMDVDEPANAEPLETDLTSTLSVMRSTKILDPASPTHSSRSVGSSRSPSPAAVSENEETNDVRAKTPLEGEEALGAPSNENDADAGGASVVMEVDAAEPDAADEQEQDPDQDRPQGQDLDIEETDDLDMEVESDLQPAYRAEALDVLAQIELKFALLRERVYVEKMEGLAWEESLVVSEIHPELTHLQNELTNRRDKRLQLASRKRSYEIRNVHKRRRADEDFIWSWWKFARDELQTEMISESNRKRRRMERDRRAIERPQPLRRIPPIPQGLPPAPSLRKIVKSLYPFNKTALAPNNTTTRCQTGRPHLQPRHNHSYLPPGQKLIYPELPALSPADIVNDLDFLYQARLEREHGFSGRFDVHPRHQRPIGVGMNVGVSVTAPTGPHHPGVSIAMASHSLGFGAGYEDGASLGGNAPGGFANGQTLPFSQQHPHPQQTMQHAIPSHIQHQPPPGPSGIGSGGLIIPPPTSHTPTPFSGPSGSRNVHFHPQPQPLHTSQYPHRHDHLELPSVQHQHRDLQQVPQLTGEQEIPAPSVPAPSHHPYFGPGGTAPARHITGRISASPPPPASFPPNGKINGNWEIHAKGAEWDGERDDVARERPRKEKEQREREREHDIERRDRSFHFHHQQNQHRHSLPPHHHHHSSQQNAHHHANGPHHHHHRPHVHVLHHHHQSQKQPQSQPGTPAGESQLPIPRSPGSIHRDHDRDYDNSFRSHHGHNQHPTEVINLTSTKPSPSQPWRNDEAPRHLLVQEHRDLKNKHTLGRPHPSSAPGIVDERETRPPAIPFAMSSSHVTSGGMSPSPSHQLHNPLSSSHLAPPVSSNGTVWNEDNAMRIPGPPIPAGGSAPPSSYQGSSEIGGMHIRSPSHRYGTSLNGSLGPRQPPPPSQPSISVSQSSRQSPLGLMSPPRSTGGSNSRPSLIPTSPSQSSTPYMNSGSARSPSRFAPPPSLSSLSQVPQRCLSPGLSSGHPSRSPPVGLKVMRPPSPPTSLTNKVLSGSLPHPTTTPPITYPSPRLSGPGRTSTPTSNSGIDGIGPKVGGPGLGNPLNSRTSSPLSTFSAHGHHGSGGLGFGPGPRSLLSNGPHTSSGGHDGNWDERDWSEREQRERERERERHVSPPHLGSLPPPAKMTLPQMVDGH